MSEMEPDEYEAVGDEMLADPPHWLFEISTDDKPRARVFGPQEKRNWVLWRLSKYAIALESQGIVSVKRYNNGNWEDANDWRNLGM